MCKRVGVTPAEDMMVRHLHLYVESQWPWWLQIQMDTGVHIHDSNLWAVLLSVTWFSKMVKLCDIVCDTIFSYFDVNKNHPEMSSNCTFWDRVWNYAFLMSLRWSLCCRSMDHVLSSQSLEYGDFVCMQRLITSTDIPVTFSWSVKDFMN